MNPSVVLETTRLRLLLPPPDYAPHHLAYVTRNREHLTPWEPPRTEEYYTEAYWWEHLARNQAEFTADRALRLAIQWKEDPGGDVIGLCNFNHFARGAFQAAILGYSLDFRFVGQGVMYEALKEALAYVFEALGFHRIMANYLPTNERSGRLLRRLGFVVEGYARDYLFIYGQWRDHVLTALTNPHPRAPGGRAQPSG